MADLAQIEAARDQWLLVLGGGGDEVRADAEARLGRCRAALEIVDARLAAIGYPVHPIVEPLDGDRLEMMHRELQDAEIPIPPLLTMVWEMIGGVSVLDLRHYSHVGFWSQRLGRNDACTDGLHIDAPSASGDDYEAYAGYLIDERESWLESGLAEDGEPFEIPIAPDDLHKDNVSGGDPYALVQHANRWDHRLAHFAWRGTPTTAPDGPPDLVSYLRTAILECGCFPGLYGLPTYEADCEHLTADLPVF